MVSVGEHAAFLVRTRVVRVQQVVAAELCPKPLSNHLVPFDGGDQLATAASTLGGGDLSGRGLRTIHRLHVTFQAGRVLVQNDDAILDSGEAGKVAVHGDYLADRDLRDFCKIE